MVPATLEEVVDGGAAVAAEVDVALRLAVHGLDGRLTAGARPRLSIDLLARTSGLFDRQIRAHDGVEGLHFAGLASSRAEHEHAERCCKQQPHPTGDSHRPS
ncbi:hypothetical protein IT414_04375 [bacterium]|nr:hypothetical protein [bacterium]